MHDFEGRTAVVTGAASGLGRELARRARSLGMRLVVSDVDARGLDAVVAELGGAPAVLAVPADVSDSGQVARLAQRAREAFGPVHLLFNNAGVSAGGYVWESGERDWQWVMGVNLMGVVHGIRHFVPDMIASSAAGEPAHVVNTASMSGWLNAPLMGVYNASKHAVVSLTETLYHDLRLAGSRVGVSLLSPAFFPTQIHLSERSRPDAPAASSPTASQRVAQAQARKAVEGGRMSAADVARIGFDAVREERFYVFPHPQILGLVERRTRCALDGQAPADPYQDHPWLRPVV